MKMRFPRPLVALGLTATVAGAVFVRPSAAQTTGAGSSTPAASAGGSDGNSSPRPPVCPADLKSTQRSVVRTSTARVSPPPPPPTAAQVAKLDAIRLAVDDLEAETKRARETAAESIRKHFARKREEVLGPLDGSIRVEKGALRDAQARAISALEKFVQDYSGARADSDATPDAMFRLAALYEERARSDESKEDLASALKPAVNLYRQIIADYPQYRERAAIFYYLGHALNDSGHFDDSQQVWRSLVCSNRYAFPTKPDPKRQGFDVIVPMPQDHPEAYWIEWRKRYPTPESLARGGADTKFVDPFPVDCVAMSQPGLKPGEEPKYVQEIWWQIGNYEFDLLDLGAGRITNPKEPDLVALPSVYGYNRAASAYSHAMQFKKPQIYGVALYKYAWTLFKQQRYEASTREFVRLLQFTDEQERLTGDPGADFRAEAYTYIAGSLTNVDFKGPAAEDPYIPRPDVVEEADTAVAERKLRIAVDRVQDPTLIPQDRPWTIDIYRNLAFEFRSLNHFQNALAVYELMLKRWPMDASAPEIQANVAETYDQLNLVNNRPGTPEHDEVAARALRARTALAAYVGSTPWVEKNRNNPAAIQKAELLARSGLRTAAAIYTNRARQSLAEAQGTGDVRLQTEKLERALAEYRLAALGWAGYIKQDENAPDAYESRYWLADAHRSAVRVSVVLHQLDAKRFGEPTQASVDEARLAAIQVRDSNEDDKYIDQGAFFVVDLADVRRDLEYVKYERTGGAQGIERRTDLKMDSDSPETARPVCERIPDSVLESVVARDEYIARVPAQMDLNKNASEYEFYAAEVFFLYGQFEEARARFEPIWQNHCGKDKYGFMAWAKLITMSNKTNDAERSRQLAQAEKAKSCAIDAEQVAARDMIVNPTLQEAAYVKARAKFKEAQAAPSGAEKMRLWKEAAALYEAAMAAAPDRDEAPEAAMNAAYAYKQVGEFNRAIDMYGMFIARYGSEERMAVLQKGDPKAKKAPDPKRYEERLKYLTDAYDALSSTYYGFFNYQRAAETLERIAANERFEGKKRREAARNATILYANMGMRDRMLRQSQVFNKLGPTPEEKANVDFVVADFDFKQWNPNGSDSGQNRTARQAAEASHAAFFQRNRTNPAAAKYALEAAWKVAKMKRAGNDAQYRAWFKNTTGAWDFFDRQGTKNGEGKRESQLPPFADYGAEADFTLVDEQVREKYDYETNHHRYAGAVNDIIGEYKDGKLVKPGLYQQSLKQAQPYDKALDEIIRKYGSPEWTAAALARKGSLADSLRTALYETRAPALKYFTAKEEKLLKQLENSGRDELMEKADQLRDLKKDEWRKARDTEIDGADGIAVASYVKAVLLAQAVNARNVEVQRAAGRLAYLTDVLGDQKLGEYVGKTEDPVTKSKVKYEEGMFLRMRPGAAVPPADAMRPLPSPVAP